MTENSRTLAEIFDADLARVGLNQKDLPALLAQEGETPISEQSISNWKNRGYIPKRRMPQLLKILGPDSELSQYTNPMRQAELVARARGVTSDAVPPLGAGSKTKNFIERNSELNRFITSTREVRERIRQALPPGLRDNYEPKVSQGGFAYYLDYFSPQAAVEIKLVPPDAEDRLPVVQENAFRRATEAITTLLAANALRPSSDRVLGLIFVCAGEISPRAMSVLNRTTFTAALLNVRVELVPDAEGAARVIETWESGAEPYERRDYDDDEI